MLEKIKNLLLKTFQNPNDDVMVSFLFGLVFLLLGYNMGNIFIKSLLYVAAIANGAVIFAASYVASYKLKQEKKRIFLDMKTRGEEKSSEEEIYEKRNLLGNNPIILNPKEKNHVSLETYINNINFTEYLIMTIGYPGYEEDLKRLDFYKVLATPNTGQETLDELDLSLYDLKNEVCEKIEEYIEAINRQPKEPRRRYRK